MAQTYKIVKKKNLGKDADSVPNKHYAIPKYNGYTEEDSLYDLIAARSTVSSADVKVVLDSLNFVLDRELRAGYIVQMGEFGNFRLSLSSSGATTQDDFNPSMLRKAKVIFTPGKNLRKTVRTTRFAAYIPDSSDMAAGEGGGGDEDDRPGEL